MSTKLTYHEAYQAMFMFVEQYYRQLGSAFDIRDFLGDTQLMENGKPLDPAMWSDWISVVNKVLVEKTDED